MKKLVNYSFVTGLLLVVSIASSILIYGRGIDNHFVADDWFFVFQVSNAHTLSDVSEFFTFNTDWFVRPTQWAITWAVYQVAALNPIPYHLISIVLEFIGALLLGFFTYRLLKAYQQPSGNYAFAAIIVAVLFLFSWRHHEAVFWYSSVNELLASLFRLSSLLLVTYLIYQKAKTKVVLISAAALGAFALAIFSKESAIVLPLELGLLLSLDYLVRSRQEGRLALYILLLAPFIVLSGLWALSYLQTSTISSVNNVERSGLSVLHTSPLNLIFRFLQYFHGNYIGTGFISKSIPLMTVELCALVFFSIVALVRKRYMWLFALFWTFIAIAPYAGMTSTDAVELHLPVLILGVTGDRFLHYSAAGASLLVVMSAQWLLDEFQCLTHRSKWSGLLKGAIGLTLLVFIVLNAYRIIEFEAGWDNAGKIGNSIVQQIHELIPNPSVGDVLCIGNLPDNLNGKYIFRNGISQALYLAYSRDDFAVRATVQPPHAFREQPQLDETNCSYILYYDGYANIVRAK